MNSLPDPEFELDRTYTVPLSRAWIAPRYKRTARAINVMREFAEKHMKSSEIKIDEDLNERMWVRGITKPPRRIKVRMTKDEDGLVTISLPKKEETESASDSEKELEESTSQESSSTEESETATTKSEKTPRGEGGSKNKK